MVFLLTFLFQNMFFEEFYHSKPDPSAQCAPAERTPSGKGPLLAKTAPPPFSRQRGCLFALWSADLCFGALITQRRSAEPSWTG